MSRWMRRGQERRPSLLEHVRDEAGDEPVEEARLGQSEAEPLDARDLIGHLRLARERFADLAEDDANADTGPDGAQAAPDPDPESGADPGRGGEREDCS